MFIFSVQSHARCLELSCLLPLRNPWLEELLQDQTKVMLLLTIRPEWKNLSSITTYVPTGFWFNMFIIEIFSIYTKATFYFAFLPLEVILLPLGDCIAVNRRSYYCQSEVALLSVGGCITINRRSHYCQSEATLLSIGGTILAGIAAGNDSSCFQKKLN